MNESQQRAVDQVRVLWPYLTFAERLVWVDQLAHLFDSFTDAVLYLGGGQTAGQ